jgi:hypothetical protein
MADSKIRSAVVDKSANRSLASSTNEGLFPVRQYSALRKPVVKV